MTYEEKVAKIISICKTQLGVKEFPPNSNKVIYNDWFYNTKNYTSDKSWCGTFVSWVFFTAGLSLGVIDYTRGFAGCPFAVKNISKWGKIVTIPKMGDIVFYDWDGNGIFDHTGIFETDLNKTALFKAYEGNTSLSNNSNGGEVMLRADRKYKNAIFVRPYVLEAA